MHHKQNISCKMSILDFRIWMHIGCNNEEKHNLQQISVDIDILFIDPPTDLNLIRKEDTISYSKVAKLVEEVSQEKPYDLIEHITSRIYEAIQERFIDKLQQKIELMVSVNKLNPPVSGIMGGVKFSIFKNCDTSVVSN